MKISPSKEPKRSSNYLLPPKRLEWPESYTPVKVKLGVDSGISDLFYTIDGTEEAELFLLWLQDFRSKAINNKRASHSDTLDVLVRILRGEAKAVVERTIAVTKGEVEEETVKLPPKPTEPTTPPGTPPATGNQGENSKKTSPIRQEDLFNQKTALIAKTKLFEFSNHLIKRKLAAFKPEEWKPYWNSDAHQKDIITECIHRLKLLIYGSDMKGKKTYTRLRRIMSNFKINYSQGI